MTAPSRRSMLMLTDKYRPAPFLVCTYSVGEDQLPTVRAAYDLEHATDTARLEAAVSCMPLVRIYAVEDVLPYATDHTLCRLVASLRL